ncbi:MAG: protease inhibitor I42 family protein [Tannerella sp.]|nr:protease inhibitor I42 family protein [Tannerella sp.]
MPATNRQTDQPDNSETVFRTSVNDQFTINFEQPSEIIFQGSAVSAGYSWRWENRNDTQEVTDTVSVEYIVEEEGRGKPATEVWTFIGKRQGEVTLKFLYRRPFVPTEDDVLKEIMVKVE